MLSPIPKRPPITFGAADMFWLGARQVVLCCQSTPQSGILVQLPPFCKVAEDETIVRLADEHILGFEIRVEDVVRPVELIYPANKIPPVFMRLNSLSEAPCLRARFPCRHLSSLR
jgi:hypothetical protein